MVKWSAAQQRRMLHENSKLWKKYSSLEGSGYLGLDFSLTSTGLVLLDDDGDLIGHEALTSAAKDGTTAQRIAAMTSPIQEILSDLRPKVIAVESINVGTHVNSLLQLARVSGAVYQIILDKVNPAPYMLFCNVSSLKTAATSDVKATKSHMLMEVYAKWGERMDTDDEADAFVAAKLGYKVDAFFRCYDDRVQNKDPEERDLDSVLMDICKERDQVFYESLEKEGITRSEANALIGIFTGSRKGGSGLNQMKENDTEFYYETRKVLKKV